MSNLTGGCTDPTTALIINALDQRLATLHSQDRAVFLEVFPYIFSEDEEERNSAIVTINEILCQHAEAIMPLPEPKASLDKWKAYISGRIRSEREKAGITQEELAKRTGISQSYICRLEQGGHSPMNKTLTNIAAALGIEVSELDPSA